MAESLGWKDFERHFDNIIPGILLSAELIALGLPVPPPLSGRSGFFQAAVFVAASYALGLVSALVSRHALDLVSERGLRAFVFERFVHGKRPDMLAYYEGIDPRLHEDLTRERERRLAVRTAEWNALYRSALRMSIRAEVDRRRAQGRIVRNLLLPSILAGVLFAKVNSLPVWLWLAIGALLIVYLYAYAELNNMAEAHDISAPRSSGSSTVLGPVEPDAQAQAPTATRPERT